MTKINQTEWMLAFDCRRLRGESSKDAMANSFRDVTGGDYDTYMAGQQVACRALMKIRAAEAYAKHSARAAAQVRS